MSTQVMCAPGPRYRGPGVREIRVAGVPAASTGRRLEVYTGRVTAIVVADDPAEALLAARALRRTDCVAGGRLAPPASDHPRTRGVTCRVRG